MEEISNVEERSRDEEEREVEGFFLGNLGKFKGN